MRDTMSLLVLELHTCVRSRCTYQSMSCSNNLVSIHKKSYKRKEFIMKNLKNSGTVRNAEDAENAETHKQGKCGGDDDSGVFTQPQQHD